MLNFLRRRRPSTPTLTPILTLTLTTNNPDLQIRSLLEYPEVRRVMGLDVAEPAEPRQLEQTAA